jgi:D-hydroxyproline dehydrogenase subunit beta
MKEKSADVIVVGAGIVGLAMAFHSAKKGKKVVVIERSQQAQGASIRNFGLIWPIGQPGGPLLDRAMRSRSTWLEVAPEAGIWLNENGSLQLAHRQDEWDIINEFYQANSNEGFQVEIVTADKAKQLSPGIKTEGLKGGLLSSTECTVDPREAISKLPGYLEKKYGVEMVFGTAVTQIEKNRVTTAEITWRAEQIFVCSGADFETLFPENFQQSGITKCKLQMMRTGAQPHAWKVGPSLCAGLTLLHYGAFKDCKSLPALQARAQTDMPDLIKWGIHVLVSQNGNGELVLGDSHEYGLSLSPFDREEINQLIMSYLSTFFEAPNMAIMERWHGIYPKLPGKTEFVARVSDHTTIVNGLSGAGMTLSFGLAEELTNTL